MLQGSPRTRGDKVTNNRSNRLKIAELTSGVGALVLGVGLGANFASVFSGSTILVIVVGAAMHAWGMFDKNRLERKATGPEPKWETALYWLCWALLAILSGYLVLWRK